MKGNATCHTTNQKFRDGWDNIKWGNKAKNEDSEKVQRIKKVLEDKR
jgi:hypothetical protein